MGGGGAERDGAGWARAGSGYQPASSWAHVWEGVLGAVISGVQVPRGPGGRRPPEAPCLVGCPRIWLDTSIASVETREVGTEADQNKQMNDCAVRIGFKSLYWVTWT